ncbi:MAG: DnaJ domain-containing protein [Alphaproteobacteria bacterium]|nr:DnaJ domain-containing protein [Alphaproteobacteria bacterium]
MIAYFVLGIALLAGFLLLAQWFVNAQPTAVIRALRWLAVAFAIVFLLVLAFTKAWQYLPALIVFLLPWLNRLRAVANLAKAARGPTRGQKSSVDTSFLQVSLDHDTGEMQGYVLQGAFEGRSLESMDLDELLVLYAECRSQDEQSAAVLAAYLDRLNPEWRERTTDGGPTASAASDGKMTLNEARKILGLGENPTEAEIKAAHRRLMKQFHPDQGGSSYLAAKINEAKELLLGKN